MESTNPDRSLLDRLRGGNSDTPAPATTAETAAVDTAPATPIPAWKTSSECVNCGNGLNDEHVCEKCGYDKKVMVESDFKN